MKLEASNPTDPPPAFSSCSHMSLLDKPSINEAVENREVPRVLKTCVVSTAMHRIAQPTIPQRTSALLSKAISLFFSNVEASFIALIRYDDQRSSLHEV
jgi:hypothetical protein